MIGGVITTEDDIYQTYKLREEKWFAFEVHQKLVPLLLPDHSLTSANEVNYFLDNNAKALKDIILQLANKVRQEKEKYLSSIINGYKMSEVQQDKNPTSL